MRTETERPGSAITDLPGRTADRPTGGTGWRRPGRLAAPLLWALALAALVTITLLTLQPPGGAGAPADREVPSRSGPAVGSQEFLQRLADQGYIPQETVDQDRLLLERLVNSGRIPAETLD